MHLGFVSLAVGVAGSSLGSQIVRSRDAGWPDRGLGRISDGRWRVSISEGADKLIAEADLVAFRDGHRVASLKPSEHFHVLPQEWTTEVAIHSAWRGDLYVILHSGDGKRSLRLTLIDNPLIRWMWFSGWIAAAGCLFRLWPL